MQSFVEIKLPDESFAKCEIIRQKRRKNLSIFIDSSLHIFIKIPEKTSILNAEDFAKKNALWIFENLKKMKNNLPKNLSFFEHFQSNNHLFAFQKNLKIIIGKSKFKSSYIFNESLNEIAVIINKQNDIKNILIEIAKASLAPLAKTLSLEFEIPINKVCIKDQSTRWGSCSSNKTISLNWRILLLEEPLQRHIILHELSHIKHPNHSGSFWDFLNSVDPSTPSSHRKISQIEKYIFWLK